MANIIDFIEKHAEGLLILLISIIIPAIVGGIRIMKRDMLEETQVLLEKISEELKKDIEIIENRTAELKTNLRLFKERQHHNENQLNQLEIRLEKTIRLELGKQTEITKVSFQFLKEQLSIIRGIVISHFEDKK